jgi:uncharacterized protein (DUF427 family)
LKKRNKKLLSCLRRPSCPGPETARARAKVFGSFFKKNFPSFPLAASHGTNIMSTRAIKIPGPDHPITIEPAASRIIVTVAGRTIADSNAALTLHEAAHPAVHYIPRQDVDMTLLQRTGHASYCPYKGEAAYYSIQAGGDRATNAVWTYEAPYDSVAAIKDHVAFYPDRVDTITEQQKP